MKAAKIEAEKISAEEAAIKATEDAIVAQELLMTRI